MDIFGLGTAAAGGMQAAGQIGAAGITAAANLANTAMQQHNFYQQMDYNRWAQLQGQAFSHSQAELGRDFSAEQARLAFDRSLLGQRQAQEYNAEQARIAFDRTMLGQHQAQDFSSREAQYGRDFAAQQQALQQEFNRGEARTARDWQERMSSTAYQRAMQDMRSAGLNPILAYQQGGASSSAGPAASSGIAGASSASSSGVGSPSASSSGAAQGHAGSAPIGAAGVLSAPGAPNLRSIMEGVAHSAAEWAKTEPTVANIKQLTRTGAAEEQQRAAGTDLTKAQEELTDQQRQTEYGRTQVVAAEAAKARIDAQHYSSEFMGWVRRMGNIFREGQNIPSFINSAKNLFSKKPGATVNRNNINIEELYRGTGL